MNRTGTTGSPRDGGPQSGVSAGRRPLGRLTAALALSSLGHWLSLPALTALAADLTREQDLPARAQAIAGVLVLMVLPALLLAPVAAALVSRLDRRIIVVAADVLRFAVVLSVPLIGSVPWTMIAAFLVAFAALPWISVITGALPALVPEDRYGEARRSVLRAAYGVAPLAAVLFAVLALIGDAGLDRADVPLYATAVVFLAAAAVTFTVSALSAPAVPGQDGVGPAPLPSPLRLLFQGQRDRGRRASGRTAPPDGPPVAGAGARPDPVTGAWTTGRGGPADGGAHAAGSGYRGGGPHADGGAYADGNTYRGAGSHAANASRAAHAPGAASPRTPAHSAARPASGAARPASASVASASAGSGETVRGFGLAGTSIALVAAAVIAVARLYARDLGGGDAGYGCLLVGLTFGLALGVFLGPRMLVPLSRRRLMGLAVIVAALALIPVALVQNLVVVVFLTAFLGLAAGVAWAVGTRLPEDARRAFAYQRAVSLITALVAFAVVPPLAALIGEYRLSLGGVVYDASGPGLALLIVALLAAAMSLVAYRRLDDRRGIPLRPDLAAALRGEVYTPPEPQQQVQGPPVIRDRGVFIAFEGGEGAGKTTQARLTAIWLRDHGYDVVSTHEPGATKIGMRLRAMLLDKETTGLTARAETLLYAADRADHVANVIRPALERGAIVVSDRYVDSSLAYQGFGREQDVSAIARVNAWAIGGLLPDLTILLEVPTETGLGRLASPADRMESESHDFHERVREGFRALAEADPDRYLIVDAGRPQAEITREIQYRIREILPDPIPAGTEDITHTFPAIKDA